MKLIVIGDIHGRESWKNLIDHSALNVFVGDYFDPYDDIPFETMRDNFFDIMKFKMQYPDNVVLLYGNHDMHYFYEGDRSTRYDYNHAADILHLFAQYKHLFYGVAYSPNEKFLISHAGLTKPWAEKYLLNITPESSVKSIEKEINSIWERDKYPFCFEANCWPGDYYGTSPQHSPVWVRSETLYKYAFNKELPWKQVVGHTQFIKIVEDGKVTKNLVFIDCLGTVPQAYEIFL